MKITVNSIKKTALVTGGLFLSVLSVNADDQSGLTIDKLLPQFSNLTPEAASLGRYGAFQVSEYSGAANISIPLYTVKSGDVSFPINLYYDATGIKVEQDATMVGLGWNLCYGGMISHIVCGKDDFCESTGYSDYNEKYWKDKTVSVPKDQPCQSLEFISVSGGLDEGCWIRDEKQLLLYDRMSKGYDNPDVYQASFCGHNISFVIDRRAGKGADGFYPITILNDNSRKYKISYQLFKSGTIYGAVNGYPSSFTIIDDKGFNYIFSRTCNENITFNEGVDSYYLTKIYGPDGEKGKSVVVFEYYDNINIHISASRPKSKLHEPNAKLISNIDDAYPLLLPQRLSNLLRYKYDRLVGNIKESYFQEIGCDKNDGNCHKVYPKRIITALDTIVFNLGTRTDLNNARSISSITIKPKTGTSVTPRKINFTYGNFSEASAKTDQYHKRLKLTSVKIDDQKYEFEYDESINLPSFASYSKDYWGYYNGANPNDDKYIGCSPAYTISNGVVKPVEHLAGSNRLASEKLCKVGMLKKVKYPTGGYTLYEFEANRFNDKYYYPDASHKISFPAATTVKNESLNMYGTMTRTLNITPSQENVELKIEGQLYGSSDNFAVTVKNSKGTIVKSLYYYNNGNKFFGETVSLSLTKGEAYTIEAKLNAATSSGSNTLASCSYRYYVQNTNITATPTTKDENGGYSIGGGVRVKTIKNYDSDGTYLNGVKYEYSGGKLLSPTVLLEKHFIDFTFGYKEPLSGAVIVDGNIPVRFSFYYANTEPSYLYICSLGIPATVGYDRVTKKEINENGNVVYRKTVFDFHNYGYITEDGITNDINSRMQNTFHFNSYYNNNPAKGHLNGKIKTETRYSDTGKLVYVANYTYASERQGSVLYHRCIPTYLSGFSYENSKYDLAFYRKFIAWSYLTQKNETFYDSNGNKTTGNITQYAYNEDNYQPMRVTVYDDKKQNSRCTCLYYPSDKDMAGGSDYLIQKHNLSEVVRTYVYDDIFNTNTFVGGSYNNYVLRNNIPVVSECRSITPAWSTVLEMEVTKHDGYGNIREYKKKNGTPVTVIWSYNHQLPIMEIVGCTYDEACSKATSLSSLENKASVPETTMSSIHSTLMKGLPNALVTAYTYSPWQSVSQIIKPNGEKTVYSYDGYGRLSTVLDANQSTFQPIQMYNYNYKNK